MSSSPPADQDGTDRITLVVDNTPFVVDRTLFSNHPDTMLGRMFGSAVENNLTRPNERGEFKVAEGMSARVFGAILEYYKTGVIYCPPTVSASELHQACDYLLIPFNCDTIRCDNMHEFLKEFSNVCLRKIFETFNQSSMADRITLVVDNTPFVVDRTLFSNHPDTMLGRMFGSALENNLTRPNERGEFKVAEGMSAAVFGAILEHYKTGVIYCPPTVSASELHQACDYLLIPFDCDTIRCDNMHEFLKEFSNVCLRKIFETFNQESIAPIIFEAAKRGESECLFSLLDDDTEGWELECDVNHENSFLRGILLLRTFSSNGQGKGYVEIVDSQVHKLLNNTVARDVFVNIWEERGFKNIRVANDDRPLYYYVRDEIVGEGGQAEIIDKTVNRCWISISWDK